MRANCGRPFISLILFIPPTPYRTCSTYWFILCAFLLCILAEGGLASPGGVDCRHDLPSIRFDDDPVDVIARVDVDFGDLFVAINLTQQQVDLH